MPYVEGHLHLGEPVFDLAVLQGRLFWAGGAKGVGIIRLDEGPQSFCDSGFCLEGGMVQLLAVDLSRGLLYASDGMSEVWLVAVDKNGRCEIKACYRCEVPLSAMSAGSGFLYLAYEDGQVSVIQAQESRLAFKGFFKTSGVGDLAVRDWVLYTGLEEGAVQVWLVENSLGIASFFQTRQVEVPGLQALCAAGRSLYAACEGAVLQFDISNQTPQEVRTRPIDVFPICVKVDGRRLYLGTVSHGVWVTDIADANAVGEAQLLPTPGAVWAVEALGGLVFAACGHSGLIVANAARWQFNAEVTERAA